MSRSSVVHQTALIVVLIASIIVAGAVGYLASSSRTVTSTVTTTASPVTFISTSVITTEITTVVSPPITTTTTTQPMNQFPSYSMTETNDSTVNSTLGLSLQLHTPSSCDSLACLGRLDIIASVVNVRNVSNNVTAESDWQYPASLLNPFDPCGSPGQVGFGIFQGNYAPNNFSSAAALGLYNQSETVSCTTQDFPNAYLLFQPNSNFAQIVNTKGEMVENGSVSVSDLVGGYWTSTVLRVSVWHIHNYRRRRMGSGGLFALFCSGCRNNHRLDNNHDVFGRLHQWNLRTSYDDNHNPIRWRFLLFGF